MEAMVVHDGVPLRFEIFPTSEDGGAGEATEYERDANWEGPYWLMESSVTGKFGFSPPRMRGRRSGSGRCGGGGGGGGGGGDSEKNIVEEADEGEVIRAMALLRSVEHLELGIPIEPYLELRMLGRGHPYPPRVPIFPKHGDPPLLTQPSAHLRLYFPPPIRAHPFTLVTLLRDHLSVLHTTALSFPDPLPPSVCVDPADVANCDDRKKRRRMSTSRWGRSYRYVAPSFAKWDAPRVVAISKDPHPAFRGGAWPAYMERPRWYLSPRPTRASPLSPRLMDDLITSILLKLPVKSLLRLKCVSRRWWELITARDFLLRHVELATRKTQLPQGRLPLLLSSDVLVLKGLRQSLNLYSYTLGEPTAQHLFEKVFPEENRNSHYAVLRHCNGLLLHATGTLIYVCNPSTGEAVTLPRGSLGVRLYDRDNVTLGFDPSTREYKVVRYFYRSIAKGSRAADVGCQVFTLGSSSGRRRPCWKLTTVNPPYPPMGGSPAFLDGVACWKVNNEQHGGSPQAFVSLDLKDGKFRVLPPPPGFSSLDDKLRDETILTQVDGRLCLFELPSYTNNKPSVELWTLDATHQCWVSMYAFHLEHPVSPKDFLPLASHDEKVVVKTPHGLSYYCPESWEFEPIVDVGPMNTYFDQGYLSVVGRRCLGYFYVAPFVESLVSPGD